MYSKTNLPNSKNQHFTQKSPSTSLLLQTSCPQSNPTPEWSGVAPATSINPRGQPQAIRERERERDRHGALAYAMVNLVVYPSTHPSPSQIVPSPSPSDKRHERFWWTSVTKGDGATKKKKAPESLNKNVASTWHIPVAAAFPSWETPSTRTPALLRPKSPRRFHLVRKVG